MILRWCWITWRLCHQCYCKTYHTSDRNLGILETNSCNFDEWRVDLYQGVGFIHLHHLEGSFPTYINIRMCMEDMHFWVTNLVFRKESDNKNLKKTPHRVGNCHHSLALSKRAAFDNKKSTVSTGCVVMGWADPPTLRQGSWPLPATGSGHFHALPIFCGWFFLVQFRCELFWEPTKMPRPSQKGGIFLPKHQLEETSRYIVFGISQSEPCMKKTPNSNHWIFLEHFLPINGNDG